MLNEEKMKKQKADRVSIRLVPLEVTVEVARGTLLKDVLFGFGVEFPCGGHGRCKGCRVRLLEGRLPVTPEEKNMLSGEELEAGWRLACRGVAEENLTLELAQWEAAVLSDDADFAFSPKEGQGIAIDLGTTTIVAQLLDFRTGRVLGVKTALNPQARFGGDIMSRVHHAVMEGGRENLESLVREEVRRLIDGVCASRARGKGRLEKIVLVGNTVLHHLFCGIDLSPLARYPFETGEAGLKTFSPSDLGWSIEGDPMIHFLPCLGSFVGSDLLAGILAIGLHQRAALTLLIDLGTNGEIVLGHRERILCASAAAGPACEAGGISMGMRAASGAIYAVKPEGESLRCEVIGGGRPRGLCGSGLVDAVAAGLTLGWIEPGGRLRSGKKAIPLLPGIDLTQKDVRELQLAKGAIAAGVRILLERWKAAPDQVESVFLAGAFGNYLNRASAQRIGLIRFPADKIHSSGNTALRGAKMALFTKTLDDAAFEPIRRKVEHVALSADPAFQDVFMDELTFLLS